MSEGSPAAFVDEGYATQLSRTDLRVLVVSQALERGGPHEHVRGLASVCDLRHQLRPDAHDPRRARLGSLSAKATSVVRQVTDGPLDLRHSDRHSSGERARPQILSAEPQQGENAR